MSRHKKRKASTGSQFQGGQNEGTLTTTHELTPQAKEVKQKALWSSVLGRLDHERQGLVRHSQIVTKTTHCFDDLATPDAAGVSGSQILHHLVPALSRLIVLGRDERAREAWNHREIAWDREYEISSYDAQASILLHLSTTCQDPRNLVLVVNNGCGGLQGWYEVGNEDETWDFIVKAEELGLAEVGKGVALPQGIYQMPQRSGNRGEIEFFHLLSEKNQTQRQGK
jgi:hypothetical protein